jgi:hypothetical protein
VRNNRPTDKLRAADDQNLHETMLTQNPTGTWGSLEPVVKVTLHVRVLVRPTSVGDELT